MELFNDPIMNTLGLVGAGILLVKIAQALSALASRLTSSKCSVRMKIDSDVAFYCRGYSAEDAITLYQEWKQSQGETDAKSTN